jgi:hypothetical protein
VTKHRKNYKEFFIDKNMSIGKRGQVVIFVIVALVIVALILLFFIFRPQVGRILGDELTPGVYLSDCIEPEVKPAVDTLADQGSYRNPEGTITFEGKPIKYLCFTDDYYEPCVVQQPMTKQNFERELNLMVRGKANQCMRNLINEYESRGYEASSGGINSETTLIPGKVLITFNTPLTVSKETTRTFETFEVEIESEMYDLLFIASSIVEYESNLGDSATELYTQYYPDLKIRKTKLSDGSTIYRLSNVVTGEKFSFASRSLAWPSGYGLEEERNAL